MTTEEDGSATPVRARRWWIVGGAVAAALALVIAIGVATGWGREPSEGVAGPQSAASPTSDSAGPSPSASASDGADPEEEAPATAAPRQTVAPVPLDQTAEPVEGVRVSLASITAISGQASVPGEVDGPALQVTVNVENANETDALTDTLIVNVYHGPERTPANILVRPREDLPLSIAPGETAKGVYAFTVPEEARSQIVVEVDLSVDLPVVLFEGAVS